MDERNYVLAIGEVYANRNGYKYLCKAIRAPGCYVLERTSDGWTLEAHIITMYADRTIEWDFSKGGHWPNGGPLKTHGRETAYMNEDEREYARIASAGADTTEQAWPDIKGYTRTPQDDGTVCYFIGNITIRVREELCGEGLHLSPVAGDQVACGQWVDLDQEELAGYCGLLERRIQADMQGLDTTMESMEEDEQEL